MNVKAILSTAVLLSTVALSSAGAFAQTGPAPAQGVMVRGQHGSNHNLRSERRRLERIIDSLQHDDRDYGGHRARAIQLLQQARAELDAALQYDRDHPGT